MFWRRPQLFDYVSSCILEYGEGRKWRAECGVWGVGVRECGSWDSEMKLEKVRVGLGEAYPDIHPTNPPGGVMFMRVSLHSEWTEKKLQAALRYILSGTWIIL